MLKDPVSVIISVYNEADTIERELREIHSEIIIKLPGSELIVAEDGSTDGTKEILKRLGPALRIIHSAGRERKGYAKAFRDAVDLAKSDYVFFTDAGGKHDFSEFWRLYEQRGPYRVVSGVRTGRTDQMYRRFLTWAYNFLLREYFAVHLHDADAGFRIYGGKVIRRIVSQPWVNTQLIASELALRAIYSGFEVKEIPVTYHRRAGISRGLPLTGMPKAIFGVVRNLVKLKTTLTAYRCAGRQASANYSSCD